MLQEMTSTAAALAASSRAEQSGQISNVTPIAELAEARAQLMRLETAVEELESAPQQDLA